MESNRTPMETLLSASQMPCSLSVFCTFCHICLLLQYVGFVFFFCRKNILDILLLADPHLLVICLWFILFHIRIIFFKRVIIHVWETK